MRVWLLMIFLRKILAHKLRTILIRNRCGAFKKNIVNNENHFRNLFKLLKKIEDNDDLISECLRIENDEITFSTFHQSASKTTAKHILNVYNQRFKIEKKLRPENHFVIGYDKLLPNIKKSKSEFINVSSIMSEFGTYLILTDYEYSEYIGILKSKRNLTEVREKMNGSEFYRETKFKNGTQILTN